MEQLGSHSTDFEETFYLRSFRKSPEKIQLSLKSDKNNGHFTRRLMHNYDILLNYSYNEKCFRQKLYRKSKHTFWCDFDRVSSLICGNRMPTRCNRGIYCRSYCLLNMFRAPLCPSSGAQEYYTVVAACGISCCVFQVAGLVWSWRLCVRFAGCLKTTARNTTGSNHCIIPLSSWWWA